MSVEDFDIIIFGGGLYGLYSAHLCGKAGKRVLVLECDDAPFKRATYINQARVHQGYHYPRSLATAEKSAGYFRRFNEDYGFAINREFEQIYATSSEYSWTSASEFERFCKAAGIPCVPLVPERYFKNNLCDGAFLTREYTYDAHILRDYFLNQIADLKNVDLRCNIRIKNIEKLHGSFEICLNDGNTVKTPYLLNVTYASTNQISKALGFDTFQIKYELCEIILCKTNEALHDKGFTVMDGPFFSIMPFGSTGLHSLTAVTFTPHTTSYDDVPTFLCQEKSRGFCNREHLGNCNDCPAQPTSAFPYMASLARKYLKDDFAFTYEKSLFSMKPILMASEIDDSRPTVIRKLSDKPTYVSVLSGKINTVYDLNEVLLND